MSGARAHTTVLAVAILLGLVAGCAWAAGGDTFAGSGQAAEAQASYDVLFTLLALAGGALIGVTAVVLPATSPVVRYGVALLGAAAAGLVAWGSGVLLGAPALQAKGAVVLWPLVVSAVFFAVFLTSLVRRGAPPPERVSAEPAAPPQPR